MSVSSTSRKTASIRPALASLSGLRHGVRCWPWLTLSFVIWLVLDDTRRCLRDLGNPRCRVLALWTSPSWIGRRVCSCLWLQKLAFQRRGASRMSERQSNSLTVQTGRKDFALNLPEISALLKQWCLSIERNSSGDCLTSLRVSRSLSKELSMVLKSVPRGGLMARTSSSRLTIHLRKSAYLWITLGRTRDVWVMSFCRSWGTVISYQTIQLRGFFPPSSMCDTEALLM